MKFSAIITYDDIDAFIMINCVNSWISSSNSTCLRNVKTTKLEDHKSRNDGLNVNKQDDRVSGLTSNPGLNATNQLRLLNTLNQYPFTCSLRTRGFRGFHRCGIALLSAPPKPTILVTAAHCTFICKDSAGFPVETCCCRQLTEPSTCRGFNSYCGENATLRMADPEDLSVTCSEWDTSQVSERFSPEEEVVLTVLNYTNHPLFNISKGPLGGNDICVLFTNDQPLKKPGVIQQGKLYPACLPTKAHKNKRGIFAGWKSTTDVGVFFNKINGTIIQYVFDPTVNGYRSKNVLHHIEVENVTCRDPAWMESNTFYPGGTICITEPSQGSCFDFGDSGSGLFLERLQGRYSWEGSLSGYRGCTATPVPDPGSAIPGSFLEFGILQGFFNGENPGIFTEGSCFLPWIAASYGMRLAKGYPTGCRGESGDREDVDNKECMAANGKRCLFNTGLTFTVSNTCDFLIGLNKSGIEWNKCILGGQGLLNPQINYRCITSVDKEISEVANTGDIIDSVCANNCPGVRASDIVAGGAAIFAVSALAATTTAALPTFLPFIGLGAVGIGAAGLMFSVQTCQGPLFCRSSQGMCCLLVGTLQQGLQCPTSC